MSPLIRPSPGNILPYSSSAQTKEIGTLWRWDHQAGKAAAKALLFFSNKGDTWSLKICLQRRYWDITNVFHAYPNKYCFLRTCKIVQNHTDLMVYIFPLYCVGKLTQIDRPQEWKMNYNNANVITKIFRALIAGFNPWEMYRNHLVHLENKCCSLTEEQQIKAASFPGFVTCILIWVPQ